MLTPKEMLHKGIFGGTYFTELVDYKDFPQDWFDGLDESSYKSTKYLTKVNLFKIKSGQSQKEWEEVFQDEDKIYQINSLAID